MGRYSEMALPTLHPRQLIGSQTVKKRSTFNSKRQTSFVQTGITGQIGTPKLKNGGVPGGMVHGMRSLAFDTEILKVFDAVIV